MAKLSAFTADLMVPFEHGVTVAFFKADPSKRLYGTPLTPPPDHAAFMAHTDTVSISQAGFVGEMLILYATSLGLATCWYGHFSLDELERVMPHHDASWTSERPKWGYGKGEPPGLRAICITPLAYWRKEGLRAFDRITGAMMSYRRKPLAELLQDGIHEDDLSPDVRYALDLARKAPSAANSQFWRFSVSNDQRTIQVAMPEGYRHFKWEHPNIDIGICASHVWLGLQLRGISPGVHVVRNNGRAIWTFSM
jgi:nitroreductase